MINLILKDFKLIKNKAIFFASIFGLGLSVLFQKIMSPEIALTIGTLIIVYLLVLYPVSYDNRRKGNMVLLSLPIKRYQVILARYITCLLFIVLSFLFIYFGDLFAKVLFSNSNFIIRQPNFNDFLIIFTAASVVISIILPVNYVFGDIGTAIVNNALFIMFLVGPNLLVNSIKRHPNNRITISIYNLIVKGPGAVKTFTMFLALILLIISVFISIFAYDRKEIA